MTRNSLLAAVASAALALTLAACGQQPPAETAEQPVAEAPAEAPMADDIVETARGAGQFTTLISAVEKAGLVDTLKGPGPFTVFAPTDGAFAAVPAEQLQALLANQEELTKVLTYHVVPGEVLSTALTSGEVVTVQGAPLTVVVAEPGVTVNGANVVQADVDASNGVIHVIDQVLLPPTS